MVKRREFLGMVTAVGGSYVLTACGGGGGGSRTGQGNTSSASATGTSAASGTTAATTNTSTTQNGRTSSAVNGTSPTSNGTTSGSSTDPNAGSNSGTVGSPNGTEVPPAASITDNQGALWTLAQGSVYRNGVAAGNTYNVTLLLWYGNGIYHQGTGGQFYGWNGTTWLACNDPRLGGTSADGTTVPSASYIIDKMGALWTVSTNGMVLRNNAYAGATSNVSLLLWYGGKLWYRSTSGQFYVCTDLDQWLPCSDPRIAVAATRGSFHGINGHYDYRYTAAQIVQIMQNMGCSTYRVGCTDDPVQLGAVTRLAQAFQAAGLTLFVLVNLGVRDANGALFANESAAYTRGRACGANVAAALSQYGVVMYECGNELTRDSAIILDSTNAGTKVADFSNANWPVMRGVMRGMIDGVKSAQANAKCGINFCVADIGAADALWDGKQPDGTSGHPAVRWDLTTWHNYEVYGDIFDIGTDGAGPGFDLPTYCKARYGAPFLLTEWNTGPEKSQSYRANYISARYATYYQARTTKNIQSVMYYELDSGDATYGVMIDGVTLNLPYNALVSFVASHPDS